MIHVATSSDKMVSIIDAFTYNGEPIAELRLKYLYDAVDVFVVGSVEDIANPEVFAPYAEKVIFVKLHEDGSETLQASHVKQNVNMINYVLIMCNIHDIPSIGTIADLRTRYFALQYPTYLQLRSLRTSRMEVSTSFCISDMRISRVLPANHTTPSTLYIPQAGWDTRDFPDDLPNGLPMMFHEFHKFIMFLKRYCKN